MFGTALLIQSLMLALNAFNAFKARLDKFWPWFWHDVKVVLAAPISEV